MQHWPDFECEPNETWRPHTAERTAKVIDECEMSAEVLLSAQFVATRRSLCQYFTCVFLEGVDRTPSDDASNLDVHFMRDVAG